MLFAARLGHWRAGGIVDATRTKSTEPPPPPRRPHSLPAVHAPLHGGAPGAPAVYVKLGARAVSRAGHLSSPGAPKWQPCPASRHSAGQAGGQTRRAPGELCKAPGVQINLTSPAFGAGAVSCSTFFSFVRSFALSASSSARLPSRSEPIRDAIAQAPAMH